MKRWNFGKKDLMTSAAISHGGGAGFAHENPFPAATGGLAGSLLALEQRYVFDAAGAIAGAEACPASAPMEQNETFA